MRVQITDGTFYVKSDGSGFTSFPQWIDAIDIGTGGNWSSWLVDGLNANWTNNVTYTIRARATDAAGHVSDAVHSFLFYDGLAQFTTLNLTLSATSIGFGGATKAALKLTASGSSTAYLAGNEIVIDVTDPDGTKATIGPFPTDPHGAVTVENFGAAGNGLLPGGGDLRFDKAGTWTLQARFAGTPALAPSNSNPPAILLVGTSAGYAVVVQGKIANGEGLESHNKTANRIYRTLLDRGFADQNIFYFNHDPAQDANGDGTPDNDQAGIGVDAVPTEAGVRQAIENLAPRVNQNPAPVYVVFVDHGSRDHKFLLNDFAEAVTPAELDRWLDALEAGLSGEARAKPRVVVVGTCYSGGFIPRLSGPNRLIVASAAADEESYKGAIEADGIRVGEYFLEEFFQDSAGAPPSARPSRSPPPRLRPIPAPAAPRATAPSVISTTPSSIPCWTTTAMASAAIFSTGRPRTVSWPRPWRWARAPTTTSTPPRTRRTWWLSPRLCFSPTAPTPRCFTSEPTITHRSITPSSRSGSRARR